jgi:hypothetical protein
VEEINLESKILKQKKQQEDKEEMERKIQLINQIRSIEKKGAPTQQKEVDLTETSGFGLLGEMSIIEVMCH